MAQEAKVAEPKRESLLVTGTFEPIPLEETDRSVSSWTLDNRQRVLINSFLTCCGWIRPLLSVPARRTECRPMSRSAGRGSAISLATLSRFP